MMNMIPSLTVLAFLTAAIAHAQLMTKLSKETNEAFEKYAAAAEPAMIESGRANRALPWLGEAAAARARKGELVMKGITGSNGHPVKDGLVHDWVGGTFIPGATLDKVAIVVQDFARHKDWYPEIIDSKLLTKQGREARGSWVLKKKKVITVVLRADLDSRYHEVSPDHAYLVSRTQPIVEVADYGTPKRREYPAGEGHGFLWRFNGYWTFHQADGGVYIECRVISLSRDVPTGLGWIVNPFIRSMPRESLESTLRHTREAVGKL